MTHKCLRVVKPQHNQNRLLSKQSDSIRLRGLGEYESEIVFKLNNNKKN